MLIHLGGSNGLPVASPECDMKRPTSQHIHDANLRECIQEGGETLVGSGIKALSMSTAGGHVLFGGKLEGGRINVDANRGNLSCVVVIDPFDFHVKVTGAVMVDPHAPI